MHDAEMQGTNQLTFTEVCYENGINGYSSISMLSAIERKWFSVSSLRVMELKKDMLRVNTDRSAASACGCVAMEAVA